MVLIRRNQKERDRDRERSTSILSRCQSWDKHFIFYSLLQAAFNLLESHISLSQYISNSSFISWKVNKASLFDTANNSLAYEIYRYSRLKIFLCNQMLQTSQILRKRTKKHFQKLKLIRINTKHLKQVIKLNIKLPLRAPWCDAQEDILTYVIFLPRHFTWIY